MTIKGEETRVYLEGGSPSPDFLDEENPRTATKAVVCLYPLGT